MVAAAAAAGVRHFIYVSSASVDLPAPHDLRARQAGRGGDRRRTSAGFAHTIVRPTLVYDETGGQEFMLFRRYLRRFPVVPFIGPGSARKRPVFSDDVVDGLARIVGNPVCFGKTYNLSGPEPITLRALGKLILELGGRPSGHSCTCRCRSAARSPPCLARVMKNPPLTPYAVAGFTNDADLDCSEAVRDLGYARRAACATVSPRCFPASAARHDGPYQARPARRAHRRRIHARRPRSVARSRAAVLAAWRSGAAPPRAARPAAARRSPTRSPAS